MSDFVRKYKKKKTYLKGNDTKSVCETKIVKQASILRKKLKLGFSLYEIPLNDDYKDFLLFIFNKEIRNEYDLLIIEHFLTHFPNLIKQLNLNKNINNISEIIHKLSIFINIEKYNKDDIICINGEIGESFYLIFEGEVSVLVPIEYEAFLTENEFYSYLNNLMNYYEYELALNSININFDIIQKNNSKNKLLEYSSLCNNPKNFINPKKNLERVNSIDYINRLIPIINEPKEDSLKLILFKYSYITNLQSGESFGDVALFNNSKKRTATIICNKNTYLGAIKRDIYKTCIKDSIEKIRRKNIETILSTKIFKGYSQDNFEIYYFNLFQHKTIFRGECLFKQNQIRDEIFFIKKGEIKIDLYANLKYLNNIVNTLAPDLNTNNFELNNLIESNYKIQNFYENLKTFQIFIINNKEVLGLDDYLLSDKKTFFATAKCNSKYCEFFSIQLDLFEKVLKEKVLRNNFSDVLNNRKKVMALRLNTIINDSIKHFENFIINKNKLNLNFNNRNFNNNNKIFLKSFSSTFQLNIKELIKKEKKNKRKSILFLTEDDYNKSKLLLEKKVFSEPKKISSKNNIKNNNNLFNDLKLKLKIPKLKIEKIPITLKNVITERNNKLKFNFNNKESVNKNLFKNLKIYNKIIDKLLDNKNNLTERNNNQQYNSVLNINLIAFDNYIENISEKNNNISNYLKNKFKKIKFHKRCFSDDKNFKTFLN